MELRDYVRILHRNWILILILLILGLAGGAGYAAMQEPKYVASTQMYVSVRTEGAATGDLVQGTTFARQMVASYVDVVSTALVLEPVIEELDLDTSVAGLSSRVSATSPLDTVLIDVTVTDADPEQAAAIANAVAASFQDAVQNTLEQPAAEGAVSPVQINVTEPAVAPSVATSPNTRMLTILGGILGLALGLGIAVLRTVLDNRIHTLHDIEALTDRPVLGGIAFDPEATKRPLIVHADPRSPRAESFRSLRTNLQFLNVDSGPRIFVVSSAGPGEGKSTTTANLAIALAETGARVLLVDGDLRLPRVADYMGIEGGVGLTDVLIGRVDVADALQKWGANDLYVLPSGQVPPNPSEMLGSAAMDQVLKPLGEYFDYVLIDAPPLLLVTDAAVIGAKTRGVIVAAASGKTKKQELAGALRTLETAGVNLLGVVVTMLPTKGPDSYGYGAYTYGSTHDIGDAESSTKKKKKAKKKSSAPKRRKVTVS
ncbi:MULTISPECIES: polysaccharide biosynthesis tyrosine autokinase [unclassified Microbacterium]|uniref:polysaccharide biosynthesis tyrosine autokinase n=1 Tax=unclassified Microbacterium TaxID=2609290 RepID=UPI000EA9EEDB|nr:MULTISPECIES: polysaccharide biosynthesis tyrosine autokinase [unclassified Microbacterium]MBT2484990.1 polysaccharide biosynthesis tyrosine autokinase [Microbacterium sp. ISL-108]RKN67842.1 polysaccharide biosynthesis tyrosine autokinase [Microbacterium sp. CGR2]